MRIRSLLVIIGTSFLNFSCNRHEDLISDPCLNYQVTSAEFTIEEAYYNRRFESDTVICNSNVFFRAKQDDNSLYEWRIGNDPRIFRTQEVMLYFSSPAILEVQLIVRKKYDVRCYPSDDRVDTITKSLVVIQSMPSYPGAPYPSLIGDFKGSYSFSPQIENVVSIKPVLHHSTLSDTTFSIFNYPIEGCEDPQFKDYFWNYCFRAVRLYQGGPIIVASCINTTEAWAVIDTSGKHLRIDFKIADLSGILTPAYFTGTRQ